MRRPRSSASTLTLPPRCRASRRLGRTTRSKTCNTSARLSVPSPQNVSKYSDRLGESVDVPQNKIQVDCQHMGGGFGSKFNFDKWGTIGALLSKQTGRPVKLMLDRNLELMIAGNRPSAFAKIK